MRGLGTGERRQFRDQSLQRLSQASIGSSLSVRQRRLPTAKLFLSYAREDAAIAERLAQALGQAGHDVWWDRDLVPGASFGSEIEQQLRDCDAVIVIWTPAGVQSPWVRDEAAIGRDSGKLVPLSRGDLEPPIGFRQFHTIDIRKGGPASDTTLDKIERAIARIAGASDRPADKKVRSRSRAGAWIAGAFALALVLALGAGLYLWRSKASANISIAVVPAAAGHSAISAEYANAIATDLASFLSAHGNSASVLDPGDPGVRNATYRFNVGYSQQGPKTDASLSMAAAGRTGIVWSESWSADTVGTVDLKKQMSLAASRALLCVLEANKEKESLNAPLLRLYIAACSSLYGSDAPPSQLAGDFAQIVEQRPSFAPAWQNLAVARALVVQQRWFDLGAISPELRNAALEAIARARTLSPRSGKSLLAEAMVAAAEGDWRHALTLLDRAIALEPNEAIYYGVRSKALQDVGRMRDAISDAERAVELDPLSPLAEGFRITALTYAGRLQSAKEELAKAYKIWPNDGNIRFADYGLSLRYGDPRHADELISKVLNISEKESLPLRKLLVARENPTPHNVDEALNAWKMRMNSNPGASQYLLALGTFGRMDEAFEFMSDPTRRRYIRPQVFFRPEFDVIRREKRFMTVAAQYGLIRYWRSTGQWPDFCNEAGLPYDCKAEAATFQT